jgi:hypothetical protein
VNAVAPALTRTELSKALWQNDALLAASVAMHPLRTHWRAGRYRGRRHVFSRR